MRKLGEFRRTPGPRQAWFKIDNALIRVLKLRNVEKVWILAEQSGANVFSRGGSAVTQLDIGHWLATNNGLTDEEKEQIGFFEWDEDGLSLDAYRGAGTVMTDITANGFSFTQVVPERAHWSAISAPTSEAIDAIRYPLDEDIICYVTAPPFFVISQVSPVPGNFFNPYIQYPYQNLGLTTSSTYLKTDGKVRTTATAQKYLGDYETWIPNLDASTDEGHFLFEIVTRSLSERLLGTIGLRIELPAAVRPNDAFFDYGLFSGLDTYLAQESVLFNPNPRFGRFSEAPDVFEVVNSELYARYAPLRLGFGSAAPVTTDANQTHLNRYYFTLNLSKLAQYVRTVDRPSDVLYEETGQVLIDLLTTASDTVFGTTPVSDQDFIEGISLNYGALLEKYYNQQPIVPSSENIFTAVLVPDATDYSVFNTPSDFENPSLTEETRVYPTDGSGQYDFLIAGTPGPSTAVGVGPVEIALQKHNIATNTFSKPVPNITAQHLGYAIEGDLSGLANVPIPVYVTYSGVANRKKLGDAFINTNESEIPFGTNVYRDNVRLYFDPRNFIFDSAYSYLQADWDSNKGNKEWAAVDDPNAKIVFIPTIDLAIAEYDYETYTSFYVYHEGQFVLTFNSAFQMDAVGTVGGEVGGVGSGSLLSYTRRNVTLAASAALQADNGWGGNISTSAYSLDLNAPIYGVVHPDPTTTNEADVYITDCLFGRLKAGSPRSIGYLNNPGVGAEEGWGVGNRYRPGYPILIDVSKPTSDGGRDRCVAFYDSTKDEVFFAYNTFANELLVRKLGAEFEKGNIFRISGDSAVSRSFPLVAF
jgi:hypothetical protein